MEEYIIDDSSLHSNPKSLIGKDFSIRIGVVREHVYLETTQQTRYIVEVWRNGKSFPMTCIRAARFGGLYNYEEFNYRGFNAGDSDSGKGNFTVVPGDMVVVAAVAGDNKEGIILSCISHGGRDEILPATDNVAFINEFNGVQTMINYQGEYRRTFKGQPTNLSKLSEPPNGTAYPLPEYDNDVGFSYYEFDKTGSYLVSDNANDDLPQSIKIDKASGKIQITSGKTSLVIDKAAESYSITNKSVTFDTTDVFNLNTKATNIMSTDVINAKAKTINTEGKWNQKGNVEITGNTKQTGNIELSGDFKNMGMALLGGGEHPLIYDIVLTIGIGNLGAPVLSFNTYLKTVKTKAT
jgi:hypothetical protein